MREWGLRRTAVATGLAVFLIGGGVALHAHRPLTFLVGDGPYYAAAAVSMAYDGDIDLRNQLKGGLAVHGTQIALGSDGSWYPKHPILMPAATLPWLATMGMDGFLVFNVVVFASLAAVLVLLAGRYAPPAAAAAAAALLMFGTFLRAYIYNLSPDLFATLIVVAGVLALLAKRPLAAGLLLGAAAAAKLLLVVLLPVAAGHALFRRGTRGAMRFAAGCLPAIAGLLCYNAALFGSPFVTSYDRCVGERGGAFVILTHRNEFGGDPMTGLAGALFDLQHGLVPTAPALFLAVPGMVLMWRRSRADAFLFVSIGTTLLLVLAPYRYWSTSHYGNRFLMPAVAMMAPALALACVRLATLAGRRPPVPTEQPVPS